jgi:hypothetical protein
MQHSNDSILIIHSLFRWAFLAILVWAVIRALSGWLGKKEWTTIDRKSGLFLMIMADMQLLLGLALYIFTSAKGLKVFQANDAGTVMRDLRYFAVEHPLMMILAIVLIHIGKTRSWKFEDAQKQHKSAAIFYGIALVFVLSRIPWDHLLTWY